MKIQGIQCSYSHEEWLQTLESVFNAESAHHEGHAYLYLNPQGQLKAFLSPLEAKQEEFHLKCTIDDVIKVSQDLFKDYQQCQSDELDTLLYAFKIMDKGAQQSWWSRLVHWWRGLGFHTTHELIEQQLQLIAERQIQSQYQEFRKILEKSDQKIGQLNHPQFKESYQESLQIVQNWVADFEQNLPQTYEAWQKKEEELTNMTLEAQQMLDFSQQVLTLMKKKEKLAKLVVLYPDVLSEKKAVEKIESALNDLVDQIFNKIALHDEEIYQQKFKALDADLEAFLSPLEKEDAEHEESSTENTEEAATDANPTDVIAAIPKAV